MRIVTVGPECHIGLLRDGLVIHGHPYYGDMLGQLLLTSDGGQTWHVVRF